LIILSFFWKIVTNLCCKKKIGKKKPIWAGSTRLFAKKWNESAIKHSNRLKPNSKQTISGRFWAIMRREKKTGGIASTHFFEKLLFDQFCKKFRIHQNDAAQLDSWKIWGIWEQR